MGSLDLEDWPKALQGSIKYQEHSITGIPIPCFVFSVLHEKDPPSSITISMKYVHAHTQDTELIGAS
jgi:hypothetical protein